MTTSIRPGFATLILVVAARLGQAQAPDSIWLTEPRWSSDRSALLFAAGPPGRLDLFMVRGDGQQLERVACSDSTDSLGEWAPNGKSIAFSSRRDGKGGIYVHELATKRYSRVTPAGINATRGLWSPDSRRIAYTVTDTGRISNIWIANADGSSARPLTTGVNRFQALAWSPDGRQVLASTRIDSATMALVRIPSGGGAAHPVVRVLSGTVFGGAWSHDGQRISFDLHEGQQSDLHVVNVDGSGLHNVTQHPARDYGVQWVPGDSALLFFSTRERQRYLFYEVRLSDGALNRLVATDHWSATAPCREPAR